MQTNKYFIAQWGNIMFAQPFHYNLFLCNTYFFQLSSTKYIGLVRAVDPDPDTDPYPYWIRIQLGCGSGSGSGFAIRIQEDKIDQNNKGK